MVESIDASCQHELLVLVSQNTIGLYWVIDGFPKCEQWKKEEKKELENERKRVGQKMQYNSKTEIYDCYWTTISTMNERTSERANNWMEYAIIEINHNPKQERLVCERNESHVQ